MHVTHHVPRRDEDVISASASAVGFYCLMQREHVDRARTFQYHCTVNLFYFAVGKFTRLLFYVIPKQLLIPSVQFFTISNSVRFDTSRSGLSHSTFVGVNYLMNYTHFSKSSHRHLK